MIAAAAAARRRRRRRRWRRRLHGGAAVHALPSVMGAAAAVDALDGRWFAERALGAQFDDGAGARRRCRRRRPHARQRRFGWGEAARAWQRARARCSSPPPNPAGAPFICVRHRVVDVDAYEYRADDHAAAELGAGYSRMADAPPPDPREQSRAILLRAADAGAAFVACAEHVGDVPLRRLARRRRRRRLLPARRRAGRRRRGGGVARDSAAGGGGGGRVCGVRRRRGRGGGLRVARRRRRARVLPAARRARRHATGLRLRAARARPSSAAPRTSAPSPATTFASAAARATTPATTGAVDAPPPDDREYSRLVLQRASAAGAAFVACPEQMGELRGYAFREGEEGRGYYRVRREAPCRRRRRTTSLSGRCRSCSRELGGGSEDFFDGPPRSSARVRRDVGARDSRERIMLARRRGCRRADG